MRINKTNKGLIKHAVMEYLNKYNKTPKTFKQIKLFCEKRGFHRTEVLSAIQSLKMQGEIKVHRTGYKNDPLHYSSNNVDYKFKSMVTRNSPRRARDSPRIIYSYRPRIL